MTPFSVIIKGSLQKIKTIMTENERDHHWASNFFFLKGKQEFLKTLIKSMPSVW
jgi:hypothetical protein